MLEIGTIRTLKVVKRAEFGVYLAEPGARLSAREKGVLLPKKQVPAGTEPGSEITVFLYRDSEGRLIATTTVPKITRGATARLEVKEVSEIGAFLDMGLERDLLLPFKEQTHKVKEGERCLVALYEDKSGRLAATMKVSPYLKCDSPYQAGDEVDGVVFKINPDYGAYVAVADRYQGMIAKKELFVGFRDGQEIRARVLKVREDGKLDLTTRGSIGSQLETDAGVILKALKESDGSLPFTDKTPPDRIAEAFHLSKAAFKRAVGHLLKEGKITLAEDGILLKEKTERPKSREREKYRVNGNDREIGKLRAAGGPKGSAKTGQAVENRGTGKIGKTGDSRKTAKTGASGKPRKAGTYAEKTPGSKTGSISRNRIRTTGNFRNKT